MIGSDISRNKTADNSDTLSDKKTSIFFPNLDGLRFFCFLSVFLYHSFATDYNYIKDSGLYIFFKDMLSENGNLGVNFFFVLSGFLITYLLLAEQDKFKKIKIGNFYIRRILRIWPLFYFCVFFGFIIFPLLKSYLGEVPNENASLLFYVFFINNFDVIEKGLPDASTLGILWSVAIEEQFYLVWPVLLTIIPRKRYLHIFALLILISLFFRFYHTENTLILEQHTLSCISDMVIGGFFATLSFTNNKFKNYIRVLPKYVWYVIYLLLIIFYLFRKEIFHHNDFLLSIDRLVISLIFIAIILEQCFAENSFYKMSKFKVVSKLGTYTYGLYCLHMIGILIAAKGLAFLGLNKNVYQVIFLEGFLSLGITIALALFSYHFYEKRFLKLKEKFARISKF